MTLELTAAQEEALQRLYNRNKLYIYDGMPWGNPRGFSTKNPITYEQFLKLVQPGPDCIMIPWCGMWLGIEPDGYTHS